MVSGAHGPLCRTGIQGLDEILMGGLPRHRFYLVQGDPGVGKTTLAMQFLIEGVAQGEKCLYVTLSETKPELLESARSHGWSFAGIEVMEIATADAETLSETLNTLFHPSEMELGRTAGVLREAVDRMKPDRMVLDSLSEFRLMAQEPLRYRRHMLSLKQYFAGLGTTVLLLDDSPALGADLQIQSIAHGVIGLRMLDSSYGAVRRQICIRKLRGLKFQDGNHDFNINTGGLEIYPRTIATAKPREYESKVLSSGIQELDDLLGGGLLSGTSSLFMGSAGTGKSSLAALFAMAAADGGEKGAIYIFEETVETYLRRSRGLGIDLERHVRTGMLKIHLIEAATLSPGEIAFRLREAVSREGVRLVIMDSLNGYLNAMPEEQFLVLQLHEILSYLNHQGVVSILVMAQKGLLDDVHSPAEITYLADTVVLLRYFEFRGSLRKAVSVLKKRLGGHEDTIRELTTHDGRLQVGKPLTEFQGILKGIPVFAGEAGAMMAKKNDA